MLSILIPNFDENVVRLVKDLHAQAIELPTDFEILICDQATTDVHLEANRTLNELEGVSYFRWNERQGRSANRNHLADQAKGEWLFFIDSDAVMIHTDTLDRFWKAKHSESAIGGTVYYEMEDPGPEYRLRWKYGRNREMKSPIDRSRNPYQSFLSFVFLIGKDSFNKVRFNESITEYGHEDTLFGRQLKYAFIRPMYIDSPVEHAGLETAEVFLNKTARSIENLEALCKMGMVDEDFRLYDMQQKLAKVKADHLVGFLFRRLRGVLEKNLLGTDPNLFIFDLWKLGYFCSLRKGVKTSSKTLRS